VSLRHVSIYSRCKAADRALSNLTFHEIAHCETADGGFICRDRRIARECTCTVDACTINV
jgi:hypothetical protein